MLEAIEIIEKLSGKKAIINYEEKAREGDHIWYISDVAKFKKDYPDWDYKYSINDIIKEIVDFEMKNGQ